MQPKNMQPKNMQQGNMQQGNRPKKNYMFNDIIVLLFQKGFDVHPH